MDALKGTGVALVTPFDGDLNIDFEGLEKLLQTTAEKGAHYYVVQGTTGESATTRPEEKTQILEFVKSNNPNNLPIVYGIGGNNTASLIDQIDSTDFSGVNAILSVSPYYNKPSQRGIIAHYSELADHCPVPIILYNVPGRTSSNLTAATTIELSRHPNIIGVKEASGDLVQASEIVKGTRDDFMLISGDDLLTLPLYSVGGVGVISVLANAFADIFRDLYASFQSGDLANARTALFKLLRINPLMYSESNPVGIKHVLQELGICKNYVRKPLVPASEQLQNDIRITLKELT